MKKQTEIESNMEQVNNENKRVTEQRIEESFGQLRLANMGWTQEDEEPTTNFYISPGLSSPHCVRTDSRN